MDAGELPASTLEWELFPRNSDLETPKDFPLEGVHTWHMWRQRKISEDAALHDFVESRDLRAEIYIRAMKTLCQRQRELRDQTQQKQLVELLRAHEKQYLDHPEITTYLESLHPMNWGVKARWGPLVLLGKSQTAKTWKAMSLFRGRTLKVSCNGLPAGVIPNISAFDRDLHSCIVFDEIRADQILGNRELFQSPPWPIKLGQSACAQHEYSVWIYMVAMVCCTNALQVNQESTTAEEDQEWLDTNCTIVTLGHGQKWFVD